MFAEETLKILRDFVEKQHGGVTLHASKALGIPNDTLNRWIKGERDPSLSKIGPVMDKILWNHALPEKIGVLEIKFPEVKNAAPCSEAEYQRLRQELENERKRTAELEKKLIAAEAIGEKLEEMMNKQLGMNKPDEPRQNKNGA